MPGSPKKNTTKPAYDRPDGIDDPELEKALEDDAKEGHDQRDALERVILRSVKRPSPPQG